MPRTKRIGIVLGMVLVLVAAIAFFQESPAPRQIAPLAIYFTVLTNSAAQSQRVECSLSNSNDRTIQFWPAAPQVNSNNGWPVGVAMLPVRFTTLRPNQTVQFTAVRPTNAIGAAWRVPVVWFLKPSKKAWVDEVMRQNFSALERGSPLPGINIGWGISEAWTNYSPEIGP